MRIGGPAVISDLFRSLSLSLVAALVQFHTGARAAIGPTGVRSRVALKGEPNARARFSSADISNAATYPAGRSAPRQGGCASVAGNPPPCSWVSASPSRTTRAARPRERIARISYLLLGSRSPANRNSSIDGTTVYLGSFPPQYMRFSIFVLPWKRGFYQCQIRRRNLSLVEIFPYGL